MPSGPRALTAASAQVRRPAPAQRQSARTEELPVRAREALGRRVGVVGTGSFVPARTLTNQDLERLVDTTDEWIVTRTGMRERRLVEPGQATSDLAVVAARRALESCGMLARDLELIVVATATPDHVCSPATACHVQRELGAPRAAGFDVSVACSGFVNALMTADSLVRVGQYDNALVIGAEVLSAVTDYRDRESCVLFGDGAGAVVLQPRSDGRVILDHHAGIDGAGAELIIVPSGGSRQPSSPDTVERREHFLRIDGRKVFRFAVGKIVEVVEAITAANGLGVDDIDLLVPHQANLRIIQAAADKLGMAMDRVCVTVDRYGNTSSASIPVALDEAVRADRLQSGDLVCLVAFGGGLSWGASLLRW